MFFVADQPFSATGNYRRISVCFFENRKGHWLCVQRRDEWQSGDFSRKICTGNCRA